MQNYVLGFLFSEDKRSVVLIKKNKPDWQKGLLNGVGGKVQEGEDPYVAMVREFEEEAGVTIPDWEFFAFMGNDSFSVHCYKAFSDKFREAKTMEEEQIQIHSTLAITAVGYKDMIPNLRWLIPMALDEDRITATIHY